MTEKSEIELVFVVADADSADALYEFFLSVPENYPGITVSEPQIESVPGAVSSEKIVAMALTFSLNVAAGVLGNVVYNAFAHAPEAECTVNEVHFNKKTISSAEELDEQMRKLSKSAVENKN